MTTLARHPEDSSAAAVAPAAQLLIGGSILAGLIVLVFWDFFRSQFYWGVRFPSDWGHTFVIPFISGYFVYLQREKIKRTPMQTAWWGLAIVALGVFAYSACLIGPSLLQHHNTRGFTVTITLFGIAYTLCGPRLMRYLWFPLLYLCVFGQAVSEVFLNHVTYRMQDIAAIGAEFTLKLIGFDAEREGNTLKVMQNGVAKSLNVAEACSGMRMLVAFLALGVAIAYTGLGKFWQQALLVLLGVPVAIFVNILRVVTLGLLTMYDAHMATGEFHHIIGLIWLLPAFLLYLGILWILRKLVIDEPPGGIAA